ncbi:peptidase C13 [Rhodanobacter thiooxydans]|uniref:Peptidase C13 n=1 Tax=Rhodanobacter thiooxydans TaxID=416169 RepID=A0A154QFU7_9GAMM|nr:C13 family peptidase [Rhodanobacter thiooxydans]EIM02060.1 Peptidase C13 family protein [Rhodanobacter thiooxydans LCS2]KZC23169.1 peptidase C13 [Rhodanobacter thiooxydans]MCW0201962.1 C13 family peptidase [Rhodanobacter thiooxydans]
MRSILTILLAFAAGVLLATWWPGQSSAPSADHFAAAAPGSAAAEAAVGDDVDADRWPSQAPTPEQVLYAQPRMMRDALAQLGPRVPGQPNLYLLAFAGDGGEDVFRNEAEYAARLFAQRFGASAHSLVLENNRASLTTRPLASWSNLETALEGLGKVMQPDQDILLLYFTSHGSEDHDLLLDMDPLPLDQLGASDLADILAMHPFKWKVVVVNACYSGGFVPPLRGPGTLVLTAARADRSSFGCGSDSDITYFGKAWLVDALNRTDNFADAFKRASGEISRWERQDKLTPSEPQIDIGSGITGQLALWRKGLTPGPALPFRPAPAGNASVATPR